MKYTTLGRSGLHVSRLCLGTMNFGWTTEEQDAFKIMDRALDAGINFFDTANVYGGKGHKGRTEEIIGRWFAQGGGRREKVVLATKVFGEMGDPNDGPNDAEGLSIYKIRRHMEASLSRLQTDHIDLYQMHRFDDKADWQEVLGVFEALVNQGKVFYIGSSNFAGWQMMKVQAEAAKRNFMGLISEQHHYNLMFRLPELEVLPAARELGIGVIPWGPLNSNVLGGKARTPEKGSRAELWGETFDDKLNAQLDAYSALCAEIGASEATVALAWMLCNPAITGPIIGPRTMQHLEDSLHAVELELTSDILAELDKIFPVVGSKS